MALFLQLVKKERPQFSPLPRIHKRFHIPYHDQGIARPREHTVNTFWSGHETDIMIWVASREADDDNVAFFSLVVVYDNSETEGESDQQRSSYQ